MGHITSDAAGLILRQAFKRVGIEGASSHSFRRTALTQMSNAGIPLRIVQEVSGHRNLEQLQRYLEVKPEQVRGAVTSLSMLSHGKIEISLFPDLKPESETLGEFFSVATIEWGTSGGD